MSPVVLVLAHGGRQAEFDRHLPMWRRHGWPVVVASPANDPVRYDGLSIVHGESAQAGPKFYHRLVHSLRTMFSLDFDYLMVHEYDSFYLSDPSESPDPLTVTGHIANNDEPNRFMAKNYAIVPWLLGQGALRNIVGMAALNPDITEEGYGDRLMGAWASLANLPLAELPEPGFVGLGAVISPDQYPALSRAIHEGARWVHGVKDAQTFQFIMDCCKKEGIL